MPKVVMGDNPAAQIHAKASSEGCFSGHWGLDGLNPVMRYGLTGGYNANAENTLGLAYCIKSWENFAEIRSIHTEVRESMAIFMESPGHKRTILEPLYRKVNIGLAWDSYILTTVLQFEGDYIDYEQRPQLDNGVLTVSGRTKNGAGFSKNTDLSVSIYYHPPPRPLTLGQLSYRPCADPGLWVGSLRPAAPSGSYYLDDTFTTSYQRCSSPYDVPPDTPAPGSYWEAKRPRLNITPLTWDIIDWIDADGWKAQGTDFAVSADLGSVLAEHGPGVYIVAIWADIDGELALISQYPLFHAISRPSGYD